MCGVEVVDTVSTFRHIASGLRSHGTTASSVLHIHNRFKSTANQFELDNCVGEAVTYRLRQLMDKFHAHGC